MGMRSQLALLRAARTHCRAQSIPLCVRSGCERLGGCTDKQWKGDWNTPQASRNSLTCDLCCCCLCCVLLPFCSLPPSTSSAASPATLRLCCRPLPVRCSSPLLSCSSP